MSDTNPSSADQPEHDPIASAVAKVKAAGASAGTAPEAATSTQSGAEAQPPGDSQREPLPSSFMMPTQLIEAWLRIPAGQYVEVGLTRNDFDRFYWAITKSLDAQTAFQNSMIDFTNNRTAEANAKLREAQRLVIEGHNDLRQLMAAIMAAATVRRPD